MLCFFLSVSLAAASSTDVERQLQELQPTASNIGELQDMMERTRQQCRQWIETVRPDATTVVRKWPRRFKENEVVCRL